MPTVDRPKCWIGVDPGASGGLACITSNGSVGVQVMPATLKDVWTWFLMVKDYRMELFAVVEKVHAFPGNGVSGMFKFGFSAGSLQAFVTAAGIPYEEVMPSVWQCGLGIPPRKKDEEKGQYKNRLKGACQRLFPDVKVTLATCDALLLAEYCRRKKEGLLK